MPDFILSLKMQKCFDLLDGEQISSYLVTGNRKVSYPRKTAHLEIVPCFLENLPPVVLIVFL